MPPSINVRSYLKDSEYYTAMDQRRLNVIYCFDWDDSPE